MFTYDGNGTYISADHGGHGACWERVKSYFLDKEEDAETGTLKIKMKNIYGGICCDTCDSPTNYYKEVSNNAVGLYEKDMTVEESEQIDFDEVYETFKDELPVTAFIFQKDRVGNYAFKEITVE